MEKKNTLSTKHLSAEDIYLFIHYFFFFGGGGGGRLQMPWERPDMKQ